MFNRTSGLGLKGESCVANLNLRGCKGCMRVM